jgi:hypothetical protein
MRVRWRNGATRKKNPGCIFAEKLVLQKGKAATPVFIETIQLILSISEFLGSTKQDLNFMMVKEKSYIGIRSHSLINSA